MSQFAPGECPTQPTNPFGSSTTKHERRILVVVRRSMAMVIAGVLGAIRKVRTLRGICHRGWLSPILDGLSKPGS